ncbi:MAG: sigma-54 dependent transcriptional regulator, partial [Sphingomonadaceae bacterium]
MAPDLANGTRSDPSTSRHWQRLLASMADAGLALPPVLPQPTPLQERLAAAVADALERGVAPVAVDPRSQDLLSDAAQVARTQTTVLIEGPSGSGKEVLARYIHAQSPRASQPFVPVNCAALPEAMLEALLFGHERGAFTGAQGPSLGLVRAADGGTLFLDELGELPLALQAKLLRMLQEREVLPLGAVKAVPVDIRIVAATNRDLSADVAQGRFREDLFWRLAVFPLRTRPLAERRADILPLAAGLIVRIARREHGRLPWLTDAAIETLIAHAFPGNVRELDNILQRAAILAGDCPIGASALRLDAAHGAVSVAGSAGDGLIVTVKAREAEAIRAALEASGGRRNLAAQRLG